jgi:acetyl esterase
MFTQDIIVLSYVYGQKEATIYRSTEVPARAALFYFHGGGLLCGSRDDLPDEHIRFLTEAGMMIIACDYPLAPSADIEDILADAESSVCELHARFCSSGGAAALPYLLWGRSAGAYLCLLMAVRGHIPPCCGVISYYGYGLLTDGWFDRPSDVYRRLPAVDPGCVEHFSGQVRMNGSLDTSYNLYVYARQSGKWLQMISKQAAKQFYRDYTLRLCDKFPVPMFCAHSLHDPDVPFAEYQALAARYHVSTYMAVAREHDFDRTASAAVLKELLTATLNFIDANMPAVS